MAGLSMRGARSRDDQKATLEKIVERDVRAPSHAPLDEGLEKISGFASEMARAPSRGPREQRPRGS